MKDGVIVRGEFFPICCQWKKDDGTQCTNHIIKGSSYCDEHYNEIYMEVDIEEFDREVEKMLGEIGNIEL